MVKQSLFNQTPEVLGIPARSFFANASHKTQCIGIVSAQYATVIKVPNHPMARIFSRMNCLCSSRVLESSSPMLLSPGQRRTAGFVNRDRLRELSGTISALALTEQGSWSFCRRLGALVGRKAIKLEPRGCQLGVAGIMDLGDIADCPH